MVEDIALEALRKNEVEQSTVHENSKIFTFEILHMIREAQQQHGLRHGDYQRYRGYCSRRIRRLRKALKYPQGDKRHFKRRDVTIGQLTGKKADERFVHIPLVSAERSWAYAMQLKQETSTNSRKKFHLIRKLRKACSYALQLQDLCNSDVFDARTKLEVEAYVAWMQGTLHFELQLWKTAGEFLKRAKIVYENLAKALPEDEQELYRIRVNEFAPTLRYCIYNISGGSNVGNVDDLIDLRAQGLLENLDVLVSQTKTEINEGLQTIEWRGRKITVRSEKIRLFLLKCQEMDKNLEKTVQTDTKIEMIERIVMDCKDALQAARDDIKQDTKTRLLTGGQNPTLFNMLTAYLSFIRHSRTLQRNLLLVEQSKNLFDDPNQKKKLVTVEGKRVRAQDLARLYEIILQNINELQHIPGLETDIVYNKEIGNLLFTFKAFRCYYIALTLIDIKKWKEAVSLYERATKYAVQALDGKTLPEFDLGADLKQLIETIDGCKFSAHAYSVMEDENIDNQVLSSKTEKLTKPLFERLQKYREDQSLHTHTPNVYKVIPDMEAIPCKPLFFDLALNYVDLPPLDDKLQVQDKKGAASISGFVKGFLGWGSNK